MRCDYSMIKITSDSTCDLPRSILEEYNISTIALGIVKNNELYRDGISITTSDIAAHVEGGGEITTTNAVSIGDYEDFFTHLRKTHDAVIHINLSGTISCCHQNACIAAEHMDGVYIVDSANLSIGQGLLTLLAAKAAAEGNSAEEILSAIEDWKGRIEMSFVLDRLDYMKKGGRCSAVAALGANLLQLHPCIELMEGSLKVVKKYRGSREKVMKDYLKERLDPQRELDENLAILVDTCEDDSLAPIGRNALAADGRFARVTEAKAGCTIFSHCGPGTLGLAVLKK